MHESEQESLFESYNKSKDIITRNKLIMLNMGLVYKFARQLSCYADDMLDLVQEGSIGILHALDNFDSSKGLKFSTYAAYWIKAYMYSFILANSGTIKIKKPTHIKLFFKLSKAREILKAKGIESTDENLAKSLDVSVQDIKTVDTLQYSKPISLDQPIRSSEDRVDCLIDTIDSKSESPEEINQIKHDYSVLMESINQELDSRYKMIMNRRFLQDIPDTLEAIGTDLGLSRERIRQMEVILWSKIEDATCELLD